MKNLITLTVAAMMVMPALALANKAEDPCPGEIVVNKMPMEHSKEKFHTVGKVKHHVAKHKAKKHVAKKHSAKKGMSKKADTMKGTAKDAPKDAPKAG